MKIGIDLGGTNTVVGLCTDTGELLQKASAPTKRGDKEKLLADFHNLAIEVCTAQNVAFSEVTQIGIGVPGSFVKETCTLTFGANLNLKQVCFSNAFLPTFQCPVYLDNDANCAALGEHVSGAGEHVDDMVMITLGTGIGGGLIIDGKLYSGSNNIAGEVGHMVIEVGGLSCNCGRHGCWETYASATGLINLAKRALATDCKSILRDYDELTAKHVCDAHDAGDPVASDIFTNYVQYLACGINNIIAILQPQRIVIGGGVAGYGHKLLTPLRKRVAQDLLLADCPQAELVLASLGNDAGVIGAAMLEH